MKGVKVEKNEGMKGIKKKRNKGKETARNWREDGIMKMKKIGTEEETTEQQ